MANKGFCPFIKKSCIKEKCAMWTRLIGTNPQNGVPMDEWGCSLAWTPILLVEIAKEMRDTGASVDKVATELNNGNNFIVSQIGRPGTKQLLGKKA